MTIDVSFNEQKREGAKSLVPRENKFYTRTRIREKGFHNWLKF